jgi:hypothetical protein
MYPYDMVLHCNPTKAPHIINRNSFLIIHIKNKIMFLIQTEFNLGGNKFKEVNILFSTSHFLSIEWKTHSAKLM